MGHGSDGCCSVRTSTPRGSLRAQSFKLNEEACGIPHASFFWFEHVDRASDLSLFVILYSNRSGSALRWLRTTPVSMLHLPNSICLTKNVTHGNLPWENVDTRSVVRAEFIKEKKPNVEMELDSNHHICCAARADRYRTCWSVRRFMRGAIPSRMLLR